MINSNRKTPYGAAYAALSNILRLRGGGGKKRDRSAATGNSDDEGDVSDFTKESLATAIEEGVAKAMKSELKQLQDRHAREIAKLRSKFLSVSASGSAATGGGTGPVATAPVIDNKKFPTCDWSVDTDVTSMLSNWKAKWSIAIDDSDIIVFHQQLLVSGALLAFLYESVGITALSGLKEFDDENSWKEILKILGKDSVKKFAKMPPDTQRRLWQASQYVKYLISLQIPVTASVFRYDKCVQPFLIQFTSILANKDKENNDLPLFKNYSKNHLGFVDESNKKLQNITGAADAPLSYVIRAQEVPDSSPVLMNNIPWEQTFQSVASMLTKHTSHQNHHWADDNAKFWQIFYDCCVGTEALPGVSGCHETGVKDGRKAWKAFSAVYCNPKSWQERYNDVLNRLVNYSWSDTKQIPLELYFTNHWLGLQEIRNAAKVIPDIEIPKDYARLSWVLTGMKVSDQNLNLRKAQVEANTMAGGKRHDFDAATTFMVAADPVKKRATSSKSGDRKTPTTFIKSVRAKVHSLGGWGKQSKCPVTNVEYRWHDRDSYQNLSEKQRTSLLAWQNTNKGKKTIAKEKKEFIKKRGRDRKKRKQQSGNVSDATKEVLSQLSPRALVKAL